MFSENNGRDINNELTLKYVDLFCRIGGFRLALEIVCPEKNIKPICVFSSDIDEDYRIKSKLWRDQITEKILQQSSTSSSRFQDDIWNDNAMPPEILTILDRINKENSGVVERYIYSQFKEKLGIISSIMDVIISGSLSPSNFELKNLIALFREEPGFRRSIDKCYEIITYSLFETIVSQLEAIITIKIPEKNHELLEKFADLSEVLLKVNSDTIDENV